MKISALALLALLVSCGLADARAPDRAAASSVPNSLDMTCAQAQEYIVRNDGAALKTGDVSANYNSLYCNTGGNPGSPPAFVRTKDSSVCHVGQWCGCRTGYCTQSYWQGVEP